jgi:hypothetical protein
MLSAVVNGECVIYEVFRNVTGHTSNYQMVTEK